MSHFESKFTGIGLIDTLTVLVEFDRIEALCARCDVEFIACVTTDFGVVEFRSDEARRILTTCEQDRSEFSLTHNANNNTVTFILERAE